MVASNRIDCVFSGPVLVLCVGIIYDTCICSEHLGSSASLVIDRSFDFAFVDAYFEEASEIYTTAETSL